MTKSPQAQATDAPTLTYELHGNLYLNITWHCTLRCDFCPKFNGEWEVQGYDLQLREEPTLEQMLQAIGDPSPYREIVFCGLGEPTTRLDLLLEIADRLKAQGARIRINTDGLANLIHGRDVTPELAGRVDALSISLNAQDETVYNRHCRPRREGAYAAMLDFTRLAKRHVPEVSLSAIDGLEGVDIRACEAIAAELGVHFKRRVLDEVG